MTFSSKCFSLVLVEVLLQFFLVSDSALASTKYIDTLCRMQFVEDKTFCLNTLTAYPPAASATSLFPLAEVVINLGVTHAEKIASLAAEAAKTEPTLTTQFKLCSDSYMGLVTYLKVALSELKKEPLSANYEVMICYDKTRYVKDLIGKNSDHASKKLMKLTLLMEKILRIVVGATEAVGA